MTDWYVLGLDRDPTPGDPDRTADLAGKLLHQAELADHNRTRLDAVARGGGDLKMEGDYAPKFREVLSELPGELGKLSSAYRGSGEALKSFASDLRQEKSRAAAAVRNGTDAATRYDGALREINALLPTGKELVVSPMLGIEASVEQATEGLDEGTRTQARAAARRARMAEQDKAAARRLADQAARLRGEAEGRAVDGINRALDNSGIKNKSWWQKAWDVVSWPFQSWDNFVKFCRGVAFVVGIVALFISGPVGWALVGVALVAGAVAFGDTLVKFTQGKASLMDLALDALGLIPGTAGAIKLAGMGTRLAEAGPRLLAMARDLPETGRILLSELRSAASVEGDALRNARALGSGPRLPMTHVSVSQVAEKFGVEISDLRIRIDKARLGYFGSTAPDETITLARPAFSNEQQLARTLAHERFHVVEQLRKGMGYPKTYSASNAWERAAEEFEDAWWASHPLNQ